ncbi:MAG TPA: UDP-N-acetylmuramate dehydrogenase [Actinomycetota bacterium]|nr:UDP-N-acetylmuramate dehydrogenase [Actinomycetota bacterium]
MSFEAIAEQLSGRLDGRIVVHAPLGPFTTFRVGGPADVLVEAESEDDLLELSTVARNVPIAIVGRGSNLLVADDGFRGVAVRLGRAFRRHAQTNGGLRLGGAVYLPAAARLTARLGLGGFEFAAEIPATFGGAVRMNAGAHERSMADVLTEATVVNLGNAERRRVGVGDLGYAYRHSSLHPSEIVTEGHVQLVHDDAATVAQRIAAHLRWRRENQPPGRSAGSVFKNPAGDSAGRLIDSVGAKGLRVGGAQVSDVHANFIVAGANATASDVWALMWRVHRMVLDETGVDLEPEVRFLGTF